MTDEQLEIAGLRLVTELVGMLGNPHVSVEAVHERGLELARSIRTAERERAARLAVRRGEKLRRDWRVPEGVTCAAEDEMNQLAAAIRSGESPDGES